MRKHLQMGLTCIGVVVLSLILLIPLALLSSVLIMKEAVKQSVGQRAGEE